MEANGKRTNQLLMTGHEMRALRLKWQWTQAQLGDFCGYNLQTISRFERELDAIPLAVAKLMHYEELLREGSRIFCPQYAALRPYDPQTL